MSTEPEVRPADGSDPPHGSDQRPGVGDLSSVATSPASEGAAETSREGVFGGKGLLGDLLVASGRCDEEAFARFYQLTSPWIFYLLRRWTGSVARAEDATRLVYTTVWRRAATFAPSDRSALAWVTTIAYDVVGP